MTNIFFSSFSSSTIFALILYGALESLGSTNKIVSNYLKHSYPLDNFLLFISYDNPHFF